MMYHITDWIEQLSETIRKEAAERTQNVIILVDQHAEEWSGSEVRRPVNQVEHGEHYRENDTGYYINSL